MKGNNQIFSDVKEDRLKGYKKLLKKNEDMYKPKIDIAEAIVEAMEAQGYDVDVEQALAYMKSSIAAFERRYALDDRR